MENSNNESLDNLIRPYDLLIDVEPIGLRQSEGDKRATWIRSSSLGAFFKDTKTVQLFTLQLSSLLAIACML